MKQRGFEIISKYQEEGLSVPQRATKGAAGYDFQAAETVVVPSLWKLQQAGENPKPILVKTGIKAYMPVIDSDYYNNENNEGHIMFQFLNFGYEDVVIEKGERIGQGIFKPFLLADDDQVEAERTGGFGSSGQK